MRQTLACGLFEPWTAAAMWAAANARSARRWVGSSCESGGNRGGGRAEGNPQPIEGTHQADRISEIDADTANVQADMWSAVANLEKDTPSTALIRWGMNDVINSQGYTQAAFWNRIPLTAWALIGIIAIACNLLLGYGERSTSWFLPILPVIMNVCTALEATTRAPCWMPPLT